MFFVAFCSSKKESLFCMLELPENTVKPSAAPIRVLLVDDQRIVGQSVGEMLSDSKDIAFYFCQDPKEALEAAKKTNPTVILQDLVMPDVDGLTLVKFFRASPQTKDIPIIVLSSKEEPHTKSRAFEFGANDYMVKFPDKLEVLARIRYHSRAYTNLCERDAALKKLQESQAALKKELDEAENYVESLLPPKLDDSFVWTDWVFKSSTALGGDCFGYHYIDKSSIAAYLLDVCGHGVGAALLSVSAMNVLRSQTLDRVDFKNPSEVLSALNSAFDMDKQNGMYFTLWYGVYDIGSRLLKYACGGHPPAVLIDAGGEKFLSAKGMVIGGIPGAEFETKTVSVGEGGKLFVFSDGVYELVNKSSGEMMSVEDFAAELQKPPMEGLSKVQSMMVFSRNAQGSDKFDDDFSLLEIKFK